MEIGSEFWDVPSQEGDRKFLLSGRTALEYILRDILSGHKVESALLPSHCCHTMIEPFLRHEIPVRFYDVHFDREIGLCAKLPMARQNEIFYYMTYFGFSQMSGMDLSEIRASYEIIIEDQTHSWLIDRTQSMADYSYTSYRKWAGFYGIAEAKKKAGCFISLENQSHYEYNSMRKNAMLLKKQYIDEKADTKQEFLRIFHEAEELLESDYVGYTPNVDSVVQLINVDFNLIKEKRRKNATVLLNGLKEIPGLTPIYGNLSDVDTPLFFPVLVERDRDDVRRYLIEQQVYCPVHWPLSEYHEGISEIGKQIYHQELSLVCDQRYGEDDMERVVKLIAAYFNERT